MQPEHAERLAALVEDAVELDGAQRSAYLAQACADDPALRAEVEALLREKEPARRAGGRGELLHVELANGRWKAANAR
jgi:hypothetical protein